MPSPRNNLSAALSRVDQDRLAEAVATLTDRYPVRVTSVPTAGLAMMRVKESVNGDAFNLGEIPLSTASVELEIGNGEIVSGAAHVMADDADLAVLMAISDAVLANRLDGQEALVELLQEGLAELRHDQDIRQSILERSRVRFALLNEVAD
jgi:phosphonate C-P lyase system protein PhnG